MKTTKAFDGCDVCTDTISGIYTKSYSEILIVYIGSPSYMHIQEKNEGGTFTNVDGKYLQSKSYGSCRVVSYLGDKDRVVLSYNDLIIKTAFILGCEKIRRGEK